MNLNDSVAKHVVKVENLAQQIKDCGDSVSETAIVTKILKYVSKDCKAPKQTSNTKQSEFS